MRVRAVHMPWDLLVLAAPDCSLSHIRCTYAVQTLMFVSKFALLFGKLVEPRKLSLKVNMTTVDAAAKAALTLVPARMLCWNRANENSIEIFLRQ